MAVSDSKQKDVGLNTKINAFLLPSDSTTTTTQQTQLQSPLEYKFQHNQSHQQLTLNKSGKNRKNRQI